MADSKQPGLWDIPTFLSEHYGIFGLVVGAILVAAIYIYTNWEKVSKWPGIDYIVAYFKRWPVPKADPNRFSIVVARLENDEKHEYQRLIVQALKEFEGIQVLALDSTIPLEGPEPEREEQRGHKKARDKLDQTGASIAVWGTVLSLGGKTVPKLYWTTSQDSERKPRRYPLVEAQFDLPTVFWSDLSEILLLLTASHYAQLTPEDGFYGADRLSPFIARVRTLLLASAERMDWGADARAGTQVILADALWVYGDQSGKNEPILEAVAACREALKEYTRDRVPLQWALTQNNLGNALWSLGERESGTERLEEAVAAYREALKEYTRDRVPLQWALTQNNLGNSLRSLGKRESGTERLEQAIAACREALKEYTRDRVPLDWALTQNNLGNALRCLGERESGTERLEEAVAAYKVALEAFESAGATCYAQDTKSSLYIAKTLLHKRQQPD